MTTCGFSSNPAMQSSPVAKVLTENSGSARKSISSDFLYTASSSTKKIFILLLFIFRGLNVQVVLQLGAGDGTNLLKTVHQVRQPLIGVHVHTIDYVLRHFLFIRVQSYYR